MSLDRFFETHRSWEDWFGMLLGLLIALSPWITGQANNGFGTLTGQEMTILNAVGVGILIFGFAQLEYVALRRWEEGCEMALGFWLIASPHIFGYSGDGTLRLWHTALGGVVVLLGILKLWQDWDLSDDELARHGQ
jgi:hypothetical protein